MMNCLQQTLKMRAGVLAMVCLLAEVISSCNKDRNVYPYGDGNQSGVTTPAAGISVIDASTDSGPLYFYLDKNRASNYPLYYSNGLDYLAAYTGKRTASFYNANTNALVKSDTITLAANNYYSLYLANLASKPDYVFLKDTLTQPATGMAKIRFVDVSTDAPAVDLGIKGKSLIASNKTYKGFSGFLTVKGDTTYTFEVRPKGSSTVLVSQTNITIRRGSIYTVWLHGLSAATDNTRLSVDIQRNASY
jgi:hypothetical protein